MKLLKSIYLNSRFYATLSAIIVVFVIGHFVPIFYAIAKIVLLAFGAITLIDLLLLFNNSGEKVVARRQMMERMSNGDENPVHIFIQNSYNFQAQIKVIDEVPFQFQLRNFLIQETFEANQEKSFVYHLKPVKRGEYNFGRLNVFVSNTIGLVSRRFQFEDTKNVAVYPSFIQMRKYELLAISNQLTDVGVKKIRRISNNNEFEQIKEYVKGDDYRTINWKATARRQQLMVNQYQDEKSQQVYSIIDMGRTMKMPFENMTLLDYSINSSLILSNISINKHDKAGLITFSNQIHTVLPAQRKGKQIMDIMESLYKQTTNFSESNYELLYVTVRRQIPHRSLLLIYTNFEGLSSLKRQLPFLKKLARNHLVVVIFFENTEVKKLLYQSENKEFSKAKDVEEVYIRTIAEKFSYEKKQIVKELKNHGIHSILTEPEHLNINTINKYLELKAKGLI